MKKIVITMNKGGIIDGVFVSPELKGIFVQLIDFCTDDLEELDDASEAWEEVNAELDDGKLKQIY